MNLGNTLNLRTPEATDRCPGSVCVCVGGGGLLFKNHPNYTHTHTHTRTHTHCKFALRANTRAKFLVFLLSRCPPPPPEQILFPPLVSHQTICSFKVIYCFCFPQSNRLFVRRRATGGTGCRVGLRRRRGARLRSASVSRGTPSPSNKVIYCFPDTR